LKLLHAAHCTIAITVVEALGQLGVNEAIPLLLALLPGHRPALRRAAIHALGRLCAREAIDGLQRLQAEDESDAVRLAAQVALTLLDDILQSTGIMDG